MKSISSHMETHRYQVLHSKYPLVNVYITMENHHAINGQSSTISMAMASSSLFVCLPGRVLHCPDKCLIGEIHVSRRVDQIQQVALSILLRGHQHRTRLRLAVGHQYFLRIQLIDTWVYIYIYIYIMYIYIYDIICIYIHI